MEKLVQILNKLLSAEENTYYLCGAPPACSESGFFVRAQVYSPGGEVESAKRQVRIQEFSSFGLTIEFRKFIWLLRRVARLCCRARPYRPVRDTHGG